MSKKSSKKKFKAVEGFCTSLMSQDVPSTQVSFITVNDFTYLGTLEGNIVKGITNLDMAKYIQARENGELTTMIVGDRGTVAIQPLNEMQQLELDRLESLWTLAESKSKSWVTSQVFAKLTGK